MFSHFLINILFLKTLTKKPKKKKKKNHFFLFLKMLVFFGPKNWRFGEKVFFLVKIFKNKLIKKVRKHSLDTRI